MLRFAPNVELCALVWQKQRTVPVGKKSVIVRDGMRIDRADFIHPHEGGDQHHQGRFGEMEVGHQPIGNLEPKSRCDEDIGRPFPRLHLALATCAFNQAQRGCAHWDDPAACGTGVIYLGCGLQCDLPPFCMHLVIRDVVDLNWQERSSPDMQGHMRAGHPTVAQSAQEGIIKMQAGGGGCDCTFVLGPRCLIIRFVRRWPRGRADGAAAGFIDHVSNCRWTAAGPQGVHPADAAGV